LYCEFPCTELCPLKKHTHTHKEGFFPSTELCKEKKRKKKTEEEEEEEEEGKKKGAGEGG
jgi:hypothetical protein